MLGTVCMNNLNYKDVPNVNLQCCICRMPFYEPVTATTCGHTFCRDCIMTALSISQQCPIDRCILTFDDLSPADPLIRNLVDELEVECPQRACGCLVVCQRQLLESHVKETCEFAEVSCQEGLCDAKILRKDARHHAHSRPKALDSSDRTEMGSQEHISCQACSAQVSASALSEHEKTCEDFPVSCNHAAHGCDWKGPRRELSASHSSKCAYEAIKGFFVIHDKEMASITEQNTILRQKVATMDGIIHALRRELTVVKTALGPWYRGDGRISHSQSRHIADTTSNIPSIPQPTQISRTPSLRQAPSSSAAPTLPASSQPATMTDTTDLSSYFPPPDQDDFILPPDGPALASTSSHVPRSPPQASQPSLQAYSTTRPPLPPYASYPQLPTIPQPPPSMSPVHCSIAPLDISTTLEGSLDGLRESIVSVSTALESLGRRQDVALTTESMRTAEEIRSLRTVIHGLRMQVHSIMMDRNAQAAGHPSEESMMPTWMQDLSPRDFVQPWVAVPYPARLPHPPLSSASTSGPKL